MKRRAIFAILAMAACSSTTSAQPEKLEGVRITSTGSGFVLSYFNYRPEVLNFFHSRGWQGGGPSWEGVGKGGLRLANSNALALIEFDPEGDALYARSPKREALAELERVLVNAANDIGFREQCINLAKKHGEME
jgi:hypothetical protein